MQTSENQDQTQIFYELALAIGSSLDLKEMIRTSLVSYMHNLECFSGVVLQLFHNDDGINYYKTVISIPLSAKYSDEFHEIYKTIPNRSTNLKVKDFNAQLPIVKSYSKNRTIYIMNLPDFGLICLIKNGDKFSENTIKSLIPLNNKLANAAIACINNQILSFVKKKAEEGDKLKTAFIENISHEIRTPLNAIIGYCSLIADNMLMKDSLTNACKTIVTSSNKLLKMIEGLLDISMLESGNLKLRYNRFNVNQFLVDLEDVFYKHVRNEQNDILNMRVVAPNDELFIITDEIRLNQIFNNLISNSVRFSDKGEIEIGYIYKDGATNKPPEKLTFYVKDRGIGIPRDQHTEIFKPFARVIQESNQKLYRGAGVGLTIVKRLVQLLGGDVWIDSKVNRGTTVYFTIRIKKTIKDLFIDNNREAQSTRNEITP